MYTNERGELKEEVPTNLPTPLGKGFVMRVYVDVMSSIAKGRTPEATVLDVFIFGEATP